MTFLSISAGSISTWIFLRARRIRLEIAGDAIVEAHAERDDQVGLLDGVIDPRLAVHAHHAERERVGRGEGAEPEQRRGDRHVGLLGERAHRRAAPDRITPCPARKSGRSAASISRDRTRELAAARAALAGDFAQRRISPDEFARRLLRVLGDVDEHRPRPPAARDGERLPDRRRDVLDARHQEVVLGDRQRDAGDVGLLERIRAEQLRRTCPVMHTIGDESSIAVAIPVTRLVAPGPDVAIATPTLPEARA